MQVRRMIPGTAGWRQLRRLYETAFPAAERRPLLRMWLLTRLRNEVTMQGWFEGSTLYGFSLTVSAERYLYIAYIAVEESRRSSGLGSRMLTELHLGHPGQTMLVEIEDPMVPADNRTQRLRRAAFYEKNGFQMLERTITGGGETYRLYATDTDYDRTAYFAALRRLSLRSRA